MRWRRRRSLRAWPCVSLTAGFPLQLNLCLCVCAWALHGPARCRGWGGRSQERARGGGSPLSVPQFDVHALPPKGRCAREALLRCIPIVLAAITAFGGGRGNCGTLLKPAVALPWKGVVPCGGSA